MNKPIVLGKNVYITIPEKKESKIIVDENTQESLHKALLKDFKKLQIWAVGDMAHSKLKEGQWVLIDPSSITAAKMVPFDDGVIRALILDHHIIHIWQ